MSWRVDNTTFVIIAESHSPAAFTESFLVNSGIKTKDLQSDTNQSFTTPAFTQHVFVDGSGIQIDPSRLIFRGVGDNPGIPFMRGAKYLKAFPHLICTAIGVNVGIQNEEENFFDLVELKKRYSIASALEVIGLGFEHTHGKCHVKISPFHETGVQADFNFDYQIPHRPLNEITFSPVSEWEEKKSIALNFLRKVNK